MATLAFSTKPEETWVVAGWALRQILDDIASQYPCDVEMAKEFEEAKAISALIVHKLPPDVAARVTSQIRAVTKGILSGAIRSGIVDQAFGDERTVAEYRKGLQQLIETIPLEGKHW